jgi:hypothetical protein
MIQLEYRNPTHRFLRRNKRRAPVNWGAVLKLIILAALLLLLLWALSLPSREKLPFPEGSTDGQLPILR